MNYLSADEIEDGIDILVNEYDIDLFSARDIMHSLCHLPIAKNTQTVRRLVDIFYQTTDSVFYENPEKS